MLPRQSDGRHCFFQILCKVQVVTVLESPGNRRSATTEVDDMAITVGMGEYVYEYQPEWPMARVVVVMMILTNCGNIELLHHL